MGNMAKLSILASVLVLAFLMGCQGDTDGIQTEPTGQQQNEPIQEEPMDEQTGPQQQEPTNEPEQEVPMG